MLLYRVPSIANAQESWAAAERHSRQCELLVVSLDWVFDSEHYAFDMLLVIGSVLVIAILVYGWFDYRRRAPIAHLGTALVKSRLAQAKSSSSSHCQ